MSVEQPEVDPPPWSVRRPEGDQCTGPVEDPTDASDPARKLVRWTRQLGVAILALVAAGAGLVALITLGQSAVDTSVRILGGILVWKSASRLGLLLRRRTGTRRLLCSLVAGTAAGVALVVSPSGSEEPLGVVAGIAVAAAGLGMSLSSLRPSNNGGRVSGFARGAALIAAGVSLAAYPESIIQIAAVTTIVMVMATLVLRVMVESGLTTARPQRSGENRPLLVRWIDIKTNSPQRIAEIHAQVFFEGVDWIGRAGRFVIIMTFASVISAVGVLTDSTAVVIGAMLVAPLISPMMGMGLALVMGWPVRLRRSALLVAVGTLVAVSVSWVAAALLDLSTGIADNSQIVSRSSPTVADLVIAVAAGAAGAYAITRKDVSSSLPGVAVAIALVPPLSVVGITAQAGLWEQTAGTLLLFLTNLVAIVVAGGLVFIVTGVVPLARAAGSQHRMRTAAATLATAGLLVVGGLVINGRSIADVAFAGDQARREISDWLGEDSEFTIVSLTTADGDVAVVLAGPGDPPAIESLAKRLSDRLGTAVRLDLQWIPRQRFVDSFGD